MKTLLSSRKLHAFTILELLCVVAIIAILAAILLPSISKAKARAKRLACVEQLHQTGIAFTVFAHEHDGKLPMAVPAQAGGSLEFAQPAPYGISDSSSFHHFQTLADELRTPRIIVCPADTRVPATNFIALSNKNVSYFVGLNAQLGNPNSVLAGDRNLTNDYIAGPCCCVLRLDAGAAIRWTRELHEFKGNLLFADGRVDKNNNPRLVAAGLKFASTDLMLPTFDSGRRPGGPVPIARPSLPAIVAAASAVAPVNAGPSAAKPSTASSKASDSTTIGNQLVEEPIAALKVPGISSNTFAWLLSKERAPDPGFCLFPESVSQLPKALVRKSVWPLWLLLVLLVAGLLTRFKWLR